MLLSNFLSLPLNKAEAPAAAGPSPRRLGAATLNSADTWRLVQKDYQVSGFINNGRDGTVLKRGRHQQSGLEVALKVIPVADPRVRRYFALSQSQ